MNDGRYTVAADNAPIFQDFLGEAPQILESMEKALLGLCAGEDAKAGVELVMRSLHTLKGIFGFLALDAMVRLCHDGETSLEAFRKGDPAPSAAVLQWLLGVLDAIRDQVLEIGRGLPSGSFDILPPAPPLEADRADEPAAGPGPAPAPAGRGPESAQDRFLRIRVEKMDSLLELVGEISICQSQVGEGLRHVGLPGPLASEVARLAKISRELQDTVLSLRLVPVEPLMLRASRVAHDVALKTGKTLEFLGEGKETELDKRMVEDLAEPVLHLVRNAVDHGLEDGAARLGAGKSAQGRLRLRASHQGGDFLLELEDDGGGLDLARLARKGLAMGLLEPGEEADEARVTALIFHPGFSTAESVTDISGRGVGLDAVRSRIQALKGDIQVSSLPGQGCRFSIRLPLTMALVEGILVRVGESRYVVPAGQVRRFSALDQAQEHRLGAGRWVESEGASLPLIDLEARFGDPAEASGRPVALHVQSLGREAMLVVDEVLGKQQVVAKSLGAGLQHLDGVAGGAILGDGKVSLILDLEALMGRRDAAQTR
jgi:two-component system chemotaxis sensor kinase CheA